MNKKVLLGREFHFGIGFLNELIDGTGKGLEIIGNEVVNNPASMVPKMMFYSLAYSYKRSQKEIDFTIDDIFDWIDENGGMNNGFFNDFLVAFQESMYKDVPVDNSKKKVTKTAK
jgi:hypothetical protein